MKSRSYLYCAFATTLNIVLNALTLGKFLWLEGGVRGGFFQNWAHQFGYRPNKFMQPETEEEIIALVKSSDKIRVFGSAHSFNSGVVTDATLVSLDKYCGAVEKYTDKNHLQKVQGENLDKFLELVHTHDPQDKFANGFTRRMFRD